MAILDGIDGLEMPHVEEAFNELASKYRMLKRDCESKVIAWRWASNHWYDPRPLHLERQGNRPGRLLKTPPKKQADKLEYGFDEHGVVHVARQHVRFEGYPERIWFYETFYVRDGDIIEASRYSYDPDDKTPISFGRGTSRDSRLVLWEDRAQRGMSREKYFWRDDKVDAISLEYVPIDDRGARQPFVHRMRYEAKHDEKGLSELLCCWPGRPDHPAETVRVIYRRTPPGVTLERLLSGLRGALLSAIVERIRSARISEPVFSLAMAWSPGQDESLPPSIGLGLARERDKWLREHGDDAKSYLWNPAEYEIFLHLESQALREACRSVNQESQLRESWRGAAKLLNDIAAELGAKDWSGILSTTDDFVAYATDLELTDFRRNLKKSAPPSIVHRLSKNGCLP